MARPQKPQSNHEIACRLIAEMQELLVAWLDRSRPNAPIAMTYEERMQICKVYRAMHEIELTMKEARKAAEA